MGKEKTLTSAGNWQTKLTNYETEFLNKPLQAKAGQVMILLIEDKWE